jgi:hypothetical protein
MWNMFYLQMHIIGNLKYYPCHPCCKQQNIHFMHLCFTNSSTSELTDWLTDWLTAWNGVVFAKLIVAQLVKFPALYVIHKFLMFMLLDPILSYMNPMDTLLLCRSLISVLILFYHLCLSTPSGLFVIINIGKTALFEPLEDSARYVLN